MTGKVVFEGSDGEDDRKLVIIEKKLDTFEKSTNNTVYPPFLAYSMSANEEVSFIFFNLSTWLTLFIATCQNDLLTLSKCRGKT